MIRRYRRGDREGRIPVGSLQCPAGERDLDYNGVVNESTPPAPRRLTRRQALIGGAAAAAAVGAGRLAALANGIVDGATATEQAVRLDPPTASPPALGGFDPGALYVALYGHPGSTNLGALGEQSLPATVDRLTRQAAAYEPFGRPVVPTFEIIATVASAFPGADGDYSNEFPDSKFEPHLDAAAERGFHVILDLQSGRSTFPSQAAEIESMLARPNVSLACDPEWRVGPDERPGGGRIGSVDGSEINATVDLLDGVVRRHALPPKMLVVHQFTPSMVTNKSIIRGTENVQIVFHMDGFGTLELKRGSWERMVSDLPQGAMTGWKNFYDNDRPTPTPAESLDNEPTPMLVTYQ